MKIDELPERVKTRASPGAGLLAMILTDKYVDHLPLYRQKQRFVREKQLVFDTKAKGYLQVDELRSNHRGLLKTTSTR